MKLALNLCLFLFALVLGEDKSFSLTDYQIKKICKQQIRPVICTKNLKEKRSNLQKGNYIEIPELPYKR